MKFADIVRAFDACSREYDLLDGWAVTVTVKDGHVFSLDGPRLDFSIFRGGNFKTVVDMPPRQLVQFAEIKAITTQWQEGVLEDLPPSTSSRVADRIAAYRAKEDLESSEDA